MDSRRNLKGLLISGLLILSFYGIYQLLSPGDAPAKTLSFSKFLEQVEEDQIRDVKITLADGGRGGTFRGHGADDRPFETTGVLSDGLITLLYERGLRFEIESGSGSGIWGAVLRGWVPMIFLVVIAVYFLRRWFSGVANLTSFRKSRAKLAEEGEVTFADVAGVDEAKEDVEEIIDFLRDPKKFTRLGGRIPKGVLLIGPPGTGKTLLARAIAGEATVPFYSLSAAEFVEMFVGVGASRVRDLFKQASKDAPCILFIDEIDAVGRQRGTGLGGGHDEREQTLNQLLSEMDGFDSNDGVILIAATNRPDVLDPALLRPGRFDRRVFVPRPDVRGREEILEIHARRTPLEPGVDLGVVARGTPGFSGADLESLVNEAALFAAHANQDALTMADFERSKDKMVMGTARKSMVIQRQEQRRMAVHEAGHALAAKLVPDTDPVHKVTIVPRGGSLGLTRQLPLGDKYSENKREILGRLVVLMGGRAAEETVLGTHSSGANDDIERATELARQMVCDWGMSDTLGPVAFGRKTGQVFLGRKLGTETNVSDHTAGVIDQEIRRIVSEQYDRASILVRGQRSELDRIVEALLEHETLSGEDLDRLLAGTSLCRDPPGTRHLITAEDAVGNGPER